MAEADTSRFPVRIAPLPPEDFTPEQAALVGAWQHLNFSRVLVRSPRMYATFLPWLETLIARTALPPRDRQIIVLRMLAQCDDVYELAHHVTISGNIGMGSEEIAAIRAGDGACLDAFDRALIAATDELRNSQSITDATWAALSARYGEEQMMEVVCLAGCYLTMAMLTKAFGMQLEDAPGDQDRINALRDYK
jgi:4-carboxymuconolactone decarboxylase